MQANVNYNNKKNRMKEFSVLIPNHFRFHPVNHIFWEMFQQKCVFEWGGSEFILCHKGFLQLTCSHLIFQFIRYRHCINACNQSNKVTRPEWVRHLLNRRYNSPRHVSSTNFVSSVLMLHYLSASFQLLVSDIHPEICWMTLWPLHQH